MLNITAADWRALFPRAPQSVIDAFASEKGTLALQRAGILDTKNRLAFALANIEHECGGFTIPKLTENIKYSAERMAQVWPNRFRTAADVVAHYGSAPGWQNKAFDAIYGNRMGNRPGTNDGSRYIGRGGPQITGRDGYSKVGGLAGLDLANNPELASLPEHQPALLAAFWEWKGLNKRADQNDWLGCVRSWNGGTNGLADRNIMMRGNDPVIQRLKSVEKLLPKIDRIEAGKPPKPMLNQEEGIAGAIVIGGGAAAVAWYSGIDWSMVAAIVVMTTAIAGAVWYKLRKVAKPPSPLL